MQRSTPVILCRKGDIDMNVQPYSRKPHFYETDQMAIIHHANYIHWFEEARVDFMEQIGYGYDRSVEEGIDFGVTSVTCDYKSMVRFGDEVEISITLKEMGSMRMTILYEVKDKKTGDLRASGESRHFYYDNTRKRPISLKKALPDLYELLQGFVAE